MWESNNKPRKIHDCSMFSSLREPFNFPSKKKPSILHICSCLWQVCGLINSRAMLYEHKLTFKCFQMKKKKIVVAPGQSNETR